MLFIEEEMKALGFQVFTGLGQCAACLLIAPNTTKLLSSALTVSPSVPVTGVAYSVRFL